MEVIAHICRFYKPVHGHLKDSFLNESMYQIMRDMAPTCDVTLSYCLWRNSVRPCHELFKPVFTERGYCFAFNALNSHEMYTNE